MLKTSKIFISLQQQLRHYYSSSIPELLSPQQMFLLFEKEIIRKTYSRPPPIISGPPTSDRYLIQMILPLAKVSNRRAWANTIPRQCQLRTMMTSTSSPSNGPATTFFSWGFPRSTVAGFGRSPAFSRQFSTTKSPCVTLFQNNASSGGQTNVFSHVSTRIFSPAGTKMSQPDISDKQASKHTIVPYTADESSNQDICSNHIFATHKNKYDKGMGELIPSADENELTNNNNKLLIRRGSSQQKRRHPINRRKLDAIIHHDDLSHENMPGNCRRRLRLKHPPDQCHVKKKDDPAQCYMLITLDTIQFWKESSSLIESIEKMAINYQIHINGVLKLLDNLQRHGKFKAMWFEGRLRIYFPAIIKTRQQAIDFLYSTDIAYENQRLFQVVEEDRLESQDEDYFNFDNNTTVGPDYFRDLQMFLDHTDYLIETSPTFRRH